MYFNRTRSALLCAQPLPAAAQAPLAADSLTGKSAPLTLEMAIRRAFENNPGLRAATHNIDIADGLRVQAGAAPNPTLSYLSEGLKKDARAITIEVSQTIELGGKRGARIAVADRERDIASADLASERGALRADVITAFFDGLSAQQRLLLTQASQALSQKVTTVAARRVMAGKISSVEETRARVAEAAIGASTGTAGALSRYELRAPFDGAIVEKHIAPASDLTSVRVGEKATVNASAIGSKATGTVSYVGVLLGEQTRTAKARVTLANPSLAWRPGLFVNAELTADERQAPVAGRADAVQSVNDTPTVYIKTAGGFVGQAVTLGRSDGQYTEIVTGITAGTTCAASGSFVVKAEPGKASAEHAH